MEDGGHDEAGLRSCWEEGGEVSLGRRREKVKPVQPLITQAPAAAAEVPCGTTWRVHNKAGFALDEACLPVTVAASPKLQK